MNEYVQLGMAEYNALSGWQLVVLTCFMWACNTLMCATARYLFDTFEAEPTFYISGRHVVLGFILSLPQGINLLITTIFLGIVIAHALLHLWDWLGTVHLWPRKSTVDIDPKE